VVGGALLAENAGAALQEIEQVSNQIASLVQNISASARSQSTAAQNIARNMQVLREISAQSADSTSATSHAIAKLADLSASLRKSITGFRLPGGSGSDMSGRHRTLPDAAATQSAKAPAPPASPPGAPGATGAYPNPKVKVLGGS
jgi:twitching motility protein PilJ